MTKEFPMPTEPVILTGEEIWARTLPSLPTFREMMKTLRCARTDCDTGPMHLEEQMEQHPYRVCCAARAAAIWIAALADANEAKDARIQALQQRIEHPEVWK